MFWIARERNVTVLELSGSWQSLDEGWLAEVTQAVLHATDTCVPALVLVDLTATTYMSSALVELLIRALKHVRQRGGQLVLCGCQPFCYEVIRITRLDQLIGIYATRQEALDWLGDFEGDYC